MRNFLAFVLALTFVFFGEMVLNYAPKGLTEPSNANIGQATNLNRENTLSTSRYQISGNRTGKVTVKDTASGEVIRTFEMDEGVVVRELFLLEDGKTVAASQKDHGVFWDLATGREIGRVNQRVYGFSHDETKFFTHDTQKGVALYAYPSLKQICQLLSEPISGPEFFLFSPDERFLIIKFASWLPATDENYPEGNLTDLGISYTLLFNLQSCQEVKELSMFNWRILKFSPDSRFLYIVDGYLGRRYGFIKGSWQFDLMTYKLQKLTE
jgi:hypothetical protein